MQAAFKTKPHGLKRGLFPSDAGLKRWWRFVLEVSADDTVFVNNHSMSSSFVYMHKNRKCECSLNEIVKRAILHRCLNIYSASASGPGALRRILIGGDFNVEK